MQRISHGCTVALLLISLTVTASATEYDWDNVYRQDDPSGPGMYAAGQLVVYFATGSIPELSLGKDGEIATNQLALDRLNSRLGVNTFERLFPALPSHSKKPDPIERQQPHLVAFDPQISSLREAAESYLALPTVSRVQPIAMVEMDAEVPDDPLLSSQTWLRALSVGLKDVRAIGGWYHQKGDPNIIICISDSGVDWQHPDLGGTAPDYTDGVIWSNLAEVNGIPGVDDDGNGKIDDIRGWDFVDVIPVNWDPADQTPPQDDAVEDADPMDYGGHGTGVSGYASAITNNGVGVAGVSWGCSIMPARVGYTTINGQGAIGTHWGARAMDYARLSGAHIYNASWGGGGASPTGGLDTAADLAVAAGLVIVKSAGNDDTDEQDYLETREDILSVAALTDSDGKASFSNYGSWVDIAAPGVGTWTTAFDVSGGGGTQHIYGPLGGTSGASPIVAGAVGLYLSANPGATGAQARAAVMAAVDDVDAVNPGYEGLLGTGRINLAKLFDNPAWLMPDQFDTLTDAINTAEPADSILVAGSMAFTKKIVLPNKPLSILGGWSDDFSTRDPVGNRVTVTPPFGDRALIASTPMGPDTILDGFDFSGGSAGILGLPSGTGRYGGGMLFLNGASPTIANSRIHDNVANLEAGRSGGGGVAIVESSPAFDNVEIDGNSALDGAGIYVYGGSPTFSNMDIHDNINFAAGLQTPDGGAIHIVGTGMAKRLDDVSIDASTISGHDVDGKGGGIYSENANLSVSNTTISNNQSGASGGGIYVTGGSYTGNGNIVSGNVIDASSGGTGGGLHATGCALSVTGSDYVGNAADFAGGGMHVDNVASPLVTQTLIAESSATTIGNALYLSNCTNTTVSQSTLANNTGAVAGSNGIYHGGGDATFSNNIFAFNGGGGVSLGDAVACLGVGTVTFNCNLAWGNTAPNYTGCTDPTGSNGNVALDPQFCDLGVSDYRIADASPAAAAQSGCGDMGSEEVGCDGTPVEDSPRRYALALGQNFPNPFNPSTTIRFTLPHDSRATIQIFDLRGRLVRRLVDEVLEAGPHVLEWHGKDDGGRQVASGIYLYELRAGSYRAVRKMGLIK